MQPREPANHRPMRLAVGVALLGLAIAWSVWAAIRWDRWLETVDHSFEIIGTFALGLLEGSLVLVTLAGAIALLRSRRS